MTVSKTPTPESIVQPNGDIYMDCFQPRLALSVGGVFFSLLFFAVCQVKGDMIESWCALTFGLAFAVGSYFYRKEVFIRDRILTIKWGLKDWRITDIYDNDEYQKVAYGTYRDRQSTSYRVYCCS